MKTPPIISLNIQKIHKSDWFVTESEIDELRKNYVFQNTPVPPGDIHSGLFIGIKHSDFEAYLSGSKRYAAVAVCEAIMRKIHGNNPRVQVRDTFV
jgi:hypothetical protein